MLVPIDVASALAEATSAIRSARDLDATLDTIVRVARDSTPGIDHVGVTLADRDGNVETRAATDDMVRQLDELQYRFGEGPCMHAIDADAIVRVRDARHEQRWPRFIPAAVGLGLRSQLGIRLHGDSKVVGALNLYSFSTDELSEESEQIAELFATHAALALGHTRRIENLSVALESRKTIGLAVGMLMQRLGIDEHTAFAYLTRMSESTEIKLRDVAASVVDEHNASLER